MRPDFVKFSALYKSFTYLLTYLSPGFALMWLNFVEFLISVYVIKHCIYGQAKLLSIGSLCGTRHQPITSRYFSPSRIRLIQLAIPALCHCKNV